MKLSPWEPDLLSIVKRIENGDIDLQPDFQRQEVWPLAKKKRLIDTILREWSIPAVHLVVTANNRMVVLDGQQRLASIRDFAKNEFSIDGNIQPLDPLVCSLHGSRFSDLNDDIRRRVENYTVRAFRISEYSPEEPNELFYRLNQPTALTAGEQRNALFGAARDQLKALVSYFEDQGNNKETIGFSNSRMSYDDIFAKFLYFLERKTFGVKSSESLISDRFKLLTPFGDDVIQRCQRSIKLFSDARAYRGYYRFNKANLLSWLLFFSRFRELEQYDFLSRFLDIQEWNNVPEITIAARRVFDDRSSLRVSDVSSVVYRDFCLWLCYYEFGYGNIPELIDISQIRHVADLYQDRDDVSFSHALNHALNPETWSVSL